MSNPEPPVVQPLLRLEVGRAIVLLQPQEAVMLRDELRAIDDPSAVRLATQIDVAATMLLAAPLHAGVRAVRVAIGTPLMWHSCAGIESIRRLIVSRASLRKLRNSFT